METFKVVSYTEVVGTTVTRLSTVLQLRDAFTHGGPVGKVKFQVNHVKHPLDKVDRQPERNSPVNFVYSDLHPGKYQVQINSEFYFPTNTLFDVNPINPIDQDIYKFSLVPRPDYVFPENTTLVRGTVTNSKAQLLTGASVQARYEMQVKSKSEEKTFSTWTSELGRYKGAYVVFFDGVHDDSFEVKMKVSMHGYKDQTQKVVVEKNKTNFANFELQEG